MADVFSEAFKQAKAPWLTREVFPMYGPVQKLLSELFKNYHDYGSSPFTAIGATDHIFAQDPAKGKIIREAKMRMQNIVMKQQRANLKPASETTAISKEDRADIILGVTGIVTRRIAKNKRILKETFEEVKQAQQTQNNRPQELGGEDVELEMLDEQQNYQEQIKAIMEEIETDTEILETRAFTAVDMKTATNTFREVQKSMSACLEDTAPAETASQDEVKTRQETPEDIWTSLVKCLVLEHKGLSTVEVNFKMTFTSGEIDTLRSIVQDEATGECQNTTAESALAFTTKLQGLEKASNWIIQVLLPQAEIKGEQLRVDGVLFRILKKNIPSHLSWAADMVQQQASTTPTKKGGTFQHLVSKIYDTLQQDSEMQKDSKEQKKKSVTFGHVAAIKGKLEKDPSARLTKEERTDTKATQVKSTFRPAMKRKAAEEPETEEEEEEEGRAKAIHFLDTQIEDPNSLHSLVGIVRGLAAEVASLAQHTTQHKPKAVCFAFQKGKCERQNCTFAHEDAQGRQSPGPAYQPPTQRPRYEQAGNSRQQQQQPQQQQAECLNFKRGACSRTNCRFSHGNVGGNQQPNNNNNYSNGRGNQQPNSNSNYNNGGEANVKREYRQDNRSEAQRPARACNKMWNESSCTKQNCTWEHGNCATPGSAGVCNSLRDRKHCIFIFSPNGCRFTHSGATTGASSGSNAMPLGNAIPQQRAPPTTSDTSSATTTNR